MAITSTKLVDDNFKIIVNANGVSAEEDQKIVDVERLITLQVNQKFLLLIYNTKF